ncbi:hypothetical protein FSB80_31375, partial [Pseudomonas aeruginosa]
MPVSPAELHGHLLGRVWAGAGGAAAAGPHAGAAQLGGAAGGRRAAGPGWGPGRAPTTCAT